MRFEHNDYFWKTIFLNSIEQYIKHIILVSLTVLLDQLIVWKLNLKALTFSLCDPLDTSQYVDGSNLFSNLAGNFEGVVQYNKDNRAFEVQSNLICLYIIILTCEILHYFML